MLGATWLLLAIFGFIAPVRAIEPFSSKYLYELGFYGLYATSSFKSTDLEVPLLNFPRWDEANCNNGYYVFAQKGKLVPNPGATIFDAKGELVWADENLGVVFNLQIQTYQGEEYLTFWSSPEGSTHGYGRGTYYMLDSSYEVFRKIEPKGEGLKGDLHEFKLTDAGTILVTIYSPVPGSLSSLGGPTEGWVLDCLFQEIDLETGELLFEWSAITNLEVTDTIRYFGYGEDDGTTPAKAFDFFHINSLDKDDEGNYIISGRHTSSILCITPEGQVKWTLGGVNSDFKDLSEGHATDFMYQHHVGLHDNYTMSIFDNAVAERSGAQSSHGYSRGLLIQLDVEKMTATLLHDYHDPSNDHAADSQGSMQVMDDRIVLGYGWLPFIKEFALDGTLLCDVEIAPWIAARWGLINTYRSFKAKHWVGRPLDPPSVYLKPSEAQLFVSWNGATEVDRWVLEGADWESLHTGGETFTALDDVKKETFETSIYIDDSMPTYIRVAAVDKDGNVLTHSATMDRRIGNAPVHTTQNILIGVTVFIVSFIAIVYLARKKGLRAVKCGSIRTLQKGVQVLAECQDRLRHFLEKDPNPASSAHIPPRRWWKDRQNAHPHEIESLREHSLDR
ncbi:Arylsulfotransferase-domain-containing protein [Xylariaceae sp. FL1019]|nr:Arylsulfotransferase-domain-containing protein [Xylariaceae sp. FL1019]